MTEHRFDAVFCDDIRQESNGKHILIGVYGGGLVPTTLPVQLGLCLWVRVTPPIVGKRHFRLGITSDGGQSGVEGDLNIEAPPFGQPIVIATGQLPVLVNATGVIRATISLDGGPEQEVGTLVVEPPRPLPQMV